MLLQVFPIKVTNAMLNESNALALYLELWLVLLFAAYVLILLMENRRQKAKLVMEKQEMRDIVDSTSESGFQRGQVYTCGRTYPGIRSWPAGNLRRLCPSVFPGSG